MSNYLDFKIEEKLLNELFDFCEFNGFTSEEDKCKEISRILRVGFNVTKFGTSPFNKPIIIPKEEEPIEEVKPKKKVGRPKKQVEVVDEVVKEQVEEKKEEEIKPRKKVRIIKN